MDTTAPVRAGNISNHTRVNIFCHGEKVPLNPQKFMILIFESAAELLSKIMNDLSLLKDCVRLVVITRAMTARKQYERT